MFRQEANCYDWPPYLLSYAPKPCILIRSRHKGMPLAIHIPSKQLLDPTFDHFMIMYHITVYAEESLQLKLLKNAARYLRLHGRGSSPVASFSRHD